MIYQKKKKKTFLKKRNLIEKTDKTDKTSTGGTVNKIHY